MLLFILKYVSSHYLIFDWYICRLDQTLSVRSPPPIIHPPTIVILKSDSNHLSTVMLQSVHRNTPLLGFSKICLVDIIIYDYF